jgi:serine/threonine-protein phosphatase PGAM5
MTIGGLAPGPTMTLASGQPAPMYRTLVLLRHGEFALQSGSLTRLGRIQAAKAGQRLRHLPVTEIYCSTLKRAHETALIVARHHRGRAPVRSHLLRECLPTMPRSHRKEFPTVTDEMIVRGRDRADRAFRRYFRRPGHRHACELLVCHGNVIRYLVGRAIGLRQHGWHGLGTSHCGITVIRILRTGACELQRYNDTGHLTAMPGDPA